MYKNINQIEEITSIKAVNDLLKQGWVVLAIAERMQNSIVFVMGKEEIKSRAS